MQLLAGFFSVLWRASLFQVSLPLGVGGVFWALRKVVSKGPEEARTCPLGAQRTSWRNVGSPRPKRLRHIQLFETGRVHGGVVLGFPASQPLASCELLLVPREVSEPKLPAKKKSGLHVAFD